MFTKYQFWYREKRSTKMASTLLFDNIRTYINGENLVGAVFIDLTKAFNTISHGTLLGKLNEYGVTGIENECLINYLFNRNQAVNIDGTISNSTPLLHGVPQGSILGPLLFLLHFNNFPDCLEKCDCAMYADDTVVYVAGKTIEIIENELEKDLEKIASYFDNSQMIINLNKGKTESLIFGIAKKLASTKKQIDIKYHGRSIESVSEYKYLGNVQHLTFSKNFE